VKRPIVLPTLPSFAAIDDASSDRVALLAALTFVEGSTSGWGPGDLIDWFKTYAAAMSRKAPPPTVTDTVVGTIALLPGAKLVGDKVARAEDLPKLLAMTRWRVIVTVRGLLSSPCDDRFLQAAIYADRVRRDHAAWIAQPRDADLLSDVVLSLFAADVLGQREFYEQNLCVCDVCGRISFNPGASGRAGCSDHLPRSETTSGFQGKGGPQSVPPSPRSER
jgi:hypothetical protein